jgi:hypothetical protein
MLLSYLSVADVGVAYGLVGYVVVGLDVGVPVVLDGQLPPPAAYPISARNSMKRMNPKSASVESSAMLCLDQYRPGHLLAIAFPIKRRAKQLLANALRR